MGGVSPGSIANRMPPAEDDAPRRARDLARTQREQAAARSLEATSIGEGGLRVIGGSINIEAGGQLTVDGDATFNGSLTVPAGSLNTAGDITAGDDVIAGDMVQGAYLDATVLVSAPAVSASGQVSGNTGVFNGGLKSTDVHTHLLTYGGAYTATWCHADGTLGTVPSSMRFKRDFTAHGLDLSALDRAEVLAFRYIDAVENLGDEAEYVLGGIAEQFVDAGLGHTVVRDEEGEPFSIEDRPLLYTLLAGYQQLVRRVAELEAQIAAH